MEKNDNDIRKEIEELEKLIDKVKKQNEEEKKKYLNQPKQRVVKINLASTFSNNFWINLIFSFLINFIVIFSLLKIFDFAVIKQDLYIIYIVVIFTILEEIYKKYLFTKQVGVVIFTSGLIFTLINVFIFYMIDLFVFVNDFSFIDYTDPIVFVIIFQVIRSIIKNLYIAITNRNVLKNKL